eukprot:SAG22_NODE_444_length_10453_cov_8.586343_12_plen_165_part_00
MFLCLSLRFHCAHIGPLQSDHRIPLASLYDGHTDAFKGTPGATSTAGLKRLWARGQRIINVGAPLSNNPSDAELARFLNATVLGVAAAEAAGIPKEDMMVYILVSHNNTPVSALQLHTVVHFSWSLLDPPFACVWRRTSPATPNRGACCPGCPRRSRKPSAMSL